MYLLNFDILLKHCLPPVWRNSWQETLLNVLLFPVKAIHTDFKQERKRHLQETATNMQVLSLQSTLIEMADGPIYIEHRTTHPFTFFVRIPKKTPNRKQKTERMEAFLERHKLAGTAYQTEVIK